MNNTANTPGTMEVSETTHHKILMNLETTDSQPEGAIARPGHTVDSAADKIICRVGRLTRLLHENLRELGYNKRLEKAVSAIPDARDRLAYIAVMTEQAAERALDATEIAKPIQDQLAADAVGLSKRWQELIDRQHSAQLDPDACTDLAMLTRNYLDDVPNRTHATNAQLQEIMMAQDFQDLTGQVIKKITSIVQDLEQDLVQLLLENVPADIRGEIDPGLMNGPVMRSEGRSDVVTNQNQVDDLLGSLGF